MTKETATFLLSLISQLRFGPITGETFDKDVRQAQQARMELFAILEGVDEYADIKSPNGERGI